MKKSKKTYAIFNLAEKHTVFLLGKTRVRVSFTGGVVTKSGVTPATFTTADPVIQLAIECSPEFQRGAVTLYSEYPLPGEVKVGRNPPVPAVGLDSRLREALEEPCAAPSPQVSGEASCEAEPLPGPEEEGEEPSVQAPPEEEAAPEEEGLQVVEASCKDVAKQYLQEHFGENPAPLRTIANVQECAAKYGITFNFV